MLSTGSQRHGKGYCGIDTAEFAPRESKGNTLASTRRRHMARKRHKGGSTSNDLGSGEGKRAGPCTRVNRRSINPGMRGILSYRNE
jgi:hypothetical protein